MINEEITVIEKVAHKCTGYAHNNPKSSRVWACKIELCELVL